VNNPDMVVMEGLTSDFMTMGDRVAVMRSGHLQQVDNPERLYARPANQFVAGFIGLAGDEHGRGAAEPHRRRSDVSAGSATAQAVRLR
jgi:ABC-type sugar transport system ATPase subunit